MSEVKVNKISPRTACGTVTLGDSGDTFTIPAGVTMTNNGTAAGFGVTGAASWDTTVKTTGFTAVSGVGYFVNTTAGAISVNLPAGTAGDVVAFKDYANTFDTNNVTLVVNGSDKIGGLNINGTLSTEGLAVTLVFVDATKGWLVTDNGTQDTAPTALYITATGGTITCSGDYRIHTFTGPGTFCVSCAGNATGSNTVDYLVVAGGGGGGGHDHGGGGGAGGFRESSGAASGCYSASPLGSGVSALSVTATSFPIIVGAGGVGFTTPGVGGQGTPGSNSTFSTITSTGGGGGNTNSFPSGLAGGSGGGGSQMCSNSPSTIGAGNTPPVSPPQGNPGTAASYNAPNYGYSSGGGATSSGTAATNTTGGAGGNGATTSISASPTTYAGGGGGSTYQGGNLGVGGPGGGGNGTIGGPAPNSANGTAGTANSGGGGGGGERCVPISGGKAGGSGIVVIRYKFQN
jgi:hypothetical protein